MDAGGRIVVGGFGVRLCLGRGLWWCFCLLLFSGGAVVRFCSSLEVELLNMSFQGGTKEKGILFNPG